MCCFTAVAQISLFSFMLNSLWLTVSVSVPTGLLALLLIVLEWTRPGLPTPLRPICDLRVLDHFIQEARDAEVAMVRGKCMHALRCTSRWKLRGGHWPTLTVYQCCYCPVFLEVMQRWMQPLSPRHCSPNQSGLWCLGKEKRKWLLQTAESWNN